MTGSGPAAADPALPAKPGRAALLLAALLVPCLAAAGWAAWIATGRAAHPTLRIAIEGYDPRDLLRGHYLQFTLDLRDAAPPGCACLEPDGGDPRRPLARGVDCAAGADDAPAVPARPASCPFPVRDPGQPFRYYADRERAQAWEAQLREGSGAASVLVHFHGDGTVSFSDLEVQDGD